ncbi:hypothetical protein ACIHCQ_30270 [Streptomyces sp. NPDC052236]|uniref:hypothetical protein n=1 Tax=Streptomyces sp. NPDC052236 TaxID=3365686 RepID=UPI0037D1F633
MVQTLAAVGELQRDLQRELTYDGLRAAEAKGSKGGRRPAVAAAKTDAVRTAYLEGRSIAALARDHGLDDEVSEFRKFRISIREMCRPIRSLADRG